MNPQTNSGTIDGELLERISRGEQSAMGELYDRHGRLLYSIILAVVRDTDTAEEILQEVFVHIWKNAGDYRTGLGTPGTWMLRIAHSDAIERLRADRLQTAAEASATTEESTLAPVEETAGGGAELNGNLASALSTLPLDERAMIDLAFLQGYSHDEIARITGVTPGTVRSRIRTGMVTLRSNLGFTSNGISVGKRS